MNKVWLDSYEAYWNKILSPFDCDIDNIKEQAVQQLESQGMTVSKDELFLAFNNEYTPPLCIYFYKSQIIGAAGITTTLYKIKGDD